MKENNNDSTETFTEKDFAMISKFLEDEELKKTFKAKQINLKQDESRHNVSNNIKKNILPSSQKKFSFDLHGKTLLESQLDPFMYNDLPYNVVFENMVREISEMYLKYVLFFLVLLFSVIILL